MRDLIVDPYQKTTGEWAGYWRLIKSRLIFHRSGLISILTFMNLPDFSKYIVLPINYSVL